MINRCVSNRNPCTKFSRIFHSYLVVLLQLHFWARIDTISLCVCVCRAMAALTRGISFRRQGSSGMSWTDSWTCNEDGVLVRKTKEESSSSSLSSQSQHFGSSLARIHDSQDDADPTPSTNPAPSVLSRSKSVGSAPPTLKTDSPRKPSASRVIKWLKKAFAKLRN